jgi:hypothetical protein
MTPLAPEQRLLRQTKIRRAASTSGSGKKVKKEIERRT